MMKRFSAPAMLRLSASLKTASQGKSAEIAATAFSTATSLVQKRASSSSSFHFGGRGESQLEFLSKLDVLGAQAPPTAPSTQKKTRLSPEKHAAAFSAFSKTKIIATIGPSSPGQENLLKELIAEGTDVCRLNFSHGTHLEHQQRAQSIRQVAAEVGMYNTLALALDTKGPEIRTRKNAAQVSSPKSNEKKKNNKNSACDGPVTYSVGDRVQIHLVGEEGRTAGTDTAAENPEAEEEDNFLNDETNLFISHPPCHELQPGMQVLVADGSATFEIEHVDLFPPQEHLELMKQEDGAGEEELPKQHMILECVVKCGAALSGRNNAHFPGVQNLDLPALSEKDVSDLQFGIQEMHGGIDFVFASFARSAEHIRQIRKVCQDAVDAWYNESAASSAGPENKTTDNTNTNLPRPFVPWIVAKIENVEGILNIDEIIQEADGIMIARGDLGMDIPIERMFMAQKMIASKCNIAGKPVICATQMLESMILHPRPTRAEATDVANAVLDGVDCVMLSGETAKGKFPVESVRTLRNISTMAEETLLGTMQKFLDVSNSSAATSNKKTDHQSIADAAVHAAFDTRASFILTTTVSGKSVLALSRLRPHCPIIAACSTLETCRKLALVNGVYPVWFGKEPTLRRPAASGDVPPADKDSEETTKEEEDWERNFENHISRLVNEVVKPLVESNVVPATALGEDGSNGGPCVGNSQTSTTASIRVIVTNTDDNQEEGGGGGIAGKKTASSATSSVGASMSVRQVQW